MDIIVTSNNFSQMSNAVALGYPTWGFFPFYINQIEDRFKTIKFDGSYFKKKFKGDIVSLFNLDNLCVKNRLPKMFNTL